MKTRIIIALLGFLVLIFPISCNRTGGEHNAGSFAGYYKLMPVDSVRYAGSPQEAAAADLIADQMNRDHLVKLDDSTGYFHEFEITSGLRQIPNRNYIRYMEQTYTLEKNQVFPEPSSPDANLDASFGWAGYGIHTKSYDDLKGINVQGKIVLILNGRPPFIRQDISLRKKISDLAEAGAKGVLVVPVSGNSSFLDRNSYTSANKLFPIPVMKVARKTAVSLMAATGNDLDAMQSGITSRHKTNSFISGLRITMFIRQQPQKRITRNVIGYIRGSRYPDRFIIVMAPYDYVKKDSMVNAESASLLKLIDLSKNHPLRYSLIFFAASGNNGGLSGLKSFFQLPEIAPIAIQAIVLLNHIAEKKSLTLTLVAGDSLQNRISAAIQNRSGDNKLTESGTLPAPSDSIEAFLYKNRIPFIGYYRPSSTGSNMPQPDVVTGRIADLSGIIQLLQRIN